MRVLVAVVAACGSDPSLAIDVQHPAGVNVASTAISVYLASDEITCETVEFGDVTSDQLAGALVAEETLFDNAPPRGSLAGLPRVDPKIVVARGLGNDGNLVAGGCAEVGEVTGENQSVTITTDVAANVSIALVDPTRENDKFGVAVTATDPSGKVLDGRHVSWRVYGPVGTMPSATEGIDTLTDPSTWQLHAPVCTSEGTVNVHPMPPNNIGGYAAQVRVSWASAPVPLVTALTPFDNKTGAVVFNAPTNNTHACALGKETDGTPALACIDGSGVTLYHGSAITGGAALTKTQTKPISAVALYTLPSGDIIAVDGTAKQAAVTGGSSPKSCPALCGGAQFDDAALVPTCGSETETLVLHDASAVLAQNSMKTMDLATGQINTLALQNVRANANASINSVGCATVLDVATGNSTSEQVVVVDESIGALQSTPRTHAEFACNTGTCSVLEVPIALSAVGFGVGAEPFMILTSIDANGVELDSGVIERQGTGSHFVAFSRLSSVAAPHRIAFGQLDDDGATDLVWTNAFKAGDLIEVGYARTINGVPLSALSTPTINIDQLLVGDVTGDQRDDVVLVSGGIAVAIPTGVAAPNGVVPADAPCTQ